MENATKALLIAGGVLIAIIILSVMVIMFQKTGNVTKTYDQTISQEEITKFNSNFTKYIGQKLTIHEVVTISNFANSNNVRKVKCSIYNEQSIKDEMDFQKENNKKHVYTINITNGEDGYISEVVFSSTVENL